MIEIMSVRMMVSEGFERAKQGEGVDVYNSLLPYLINGSLPAKSHYAFGWIIYYALHFSSSAEIQARKLMLANYLKLQVTKPHKLHSMILTEAIRLYKDVQNAVFNARGADIPSFSLVSFLNLWNLNYLRPGDWRRHSLDDKMLGSTVEKMLTHCVDELSRKNDIAMLSPTFLEVMDKAVVEFGDSFNLLAQRAEVYRIENRLEEANIFLRKAIMLAPGKFFLWSRLADLISDENQLRLRVALLGKALTSSGPEQFKGRIRISLANAWIANGNFEYALHELLIAKNTYEQNGWHLPKSYASAFEKIPEGIEASDTTSIYKRLSPIAENYVYEIVEPIITSKTYHKAPKPGNGGYGRPAVAWRLTDSEGNNHWIQPHRYGLSPDMPMGTRLLLRIVNGKPVHAALPIEE